MAHKFGGFWTEKKIDIFIKYLKAYLQIMNKQNFKLIYFDGFAGSGEIEKSSGFSSLIEGVASRVISIDSPRPFDLYYLVELNKKRSDELILHLSTKYPDKKNAITVQNADCNEKLTRMSDFMRENNNYRALAFIDPHGMEVNWKSIESFKGVNVDMWLLIPTGGANRMLKRDGTISTAWMNRLSKFFGITGDDIKARFYKETTVNTLFGEEEMTYKATDSIEKVLQLYIEQLRNIFTFVSKGYPLKNKRGVILFHFLLCSQNKYAIKIADSIIGKELIL